MRVVLDLHDLDLRMRRKQPVQNLGLIVERRADVTDQSLFLELLYHAERVEPLVFFDELVAHRVEQIEIEVFDAARCKLRLKQRTDLRFRLEEVRGELVGQHVAFARIARGQPFLERAFALSVVIAVRRVKVIETRVEIAVHHRAEIVHIDFALLVELHAHAAEPELAVEKIRKPFHTRSSAVFLLLL